MAKLTTARLRNLAIALCVGLVLAAGGWLAALVRLGLPGYVHAERVCVEITVATLVLATGLGWFFHRHLRVRGALAAAVLLASSTVAVAEAVWFADVTGSSFGVTYVGALPVPALDLTIDQDGHLGFRPKSHRITLPEVLDLIDETTQVVVLGVGWEGGAHVDREVLELPGLEVLVLRTGHAIEAYEAIRAHGGRAALLLHTTC